MLNPVSYNRRSHRRMAYAIAAISFLTLNVVVFVYWEKVVDFQRLPVWSPPRVAFCISGAVRYWDMLRLTREIGLIMPNSPSDLFFALSFDDSPISNISFEMLEEELSQKAKRFHLEIWGDVERELSDNWPELPFPRVFDSTLSNVTRQMHILSHFRSEYLCGKLIREEEMKRGLRYEVVAHIRPDIVYSFLRHHTLQLSRLGSFSSDVRDWYETNKNRSYNVSKIWFPEYVAVPRCCDWEGLNDQVAFGGSHVMEEYAKVYTDVRNLISFETSFHPEHLLLAHVISLGLPVARFPFPYYMLMNPGRTKRFFDDPRNYVENCYYEEGVWEGFQYPSVDLLYKSL